MGEGGRDGGREEGGIEGGMEGGRRMEGGRGREERFKMAVPTTYL